MSDYKALLKHSGNYLFAILATKALAFISLPIYTSLMTVEEYGVYNVFISTVGIATIILTLNTEIAVSRYYYDRKSDEDFSEFVATSVKLSSFVFFIMSIILVAFLDLFSNLLNFEKLLTLSIIPVSLYNIINSVFQQIYQPMLQSKKIAITTSIQAYLAFALSVSGILLMNEKRYYGQVLGTILAMLLLSYYLVIQIKTYYKSSFKWDYVKYILKYSLPYLPYSLSGIIIAQLGKLLIGQQSGFETAGLYSFSSNIAVLMLVYILMIHNAWNPYYYRYMNFNDYTSIDNDYDIIWRGTLVLSLGISTFGYELGYILGNKEYLNELYLIPILTLGYCFYQWAYVYMRNVGYIKKTIWNALVVVSSGLINIILNTVLINYWGILGIAISFLISYFFMCVFSLIINKTILKVYAPVTIKFIVPFLIFIPFWILSFLWISTNSILIFIIKLSFYLLFIIVIGWPYRRFLCKNSHE